MEKLLFLSHRIPYPPDKGDKIRAWNMLAHLARRYSVHLGCLADDPEDLSHVGFLSTICASVCCVPLDRRRGKLAALWRVRPGRSLTQGYFHHPTLQRWVTEIVARERIGRAFVFSSAMAPYVADYTTLDRTLDMVDIDSEKWTEYARRARGPARLVWQREGSTLFALERRAALAFERTIFVSEPECRRFATLAPETQDRVDWVENGVDGERFSPALHFENPFADAAPHVVFTGRMDYWPNVDAVTWFADAVLPRLREADPRICFAIVGAAPDAQVLRLGERPGVMVTGRVPDIRPYLAHASAVVAPLRIARGIQNKVLEAMAMARPVICTSQAFEGLRARPGRDLLVADGAEAMARAVHGVLRGEHAGLGRAAREAIERGYRWDTTLRRLDVLLVNDPVEPELARMG